MPKQTFLNLPASKQQSILNAAILEFSRVPLADASINQIIKTSKIPRGSFYMYFDSKEELYNFLLEKFFDFFITAKGKLLKKYKGDLINTYIKLFDVIYKECSSESRKDFFKNVFINMNYKTEEEFPMNKEYIISKVGSSFDLVDKEKLNIHDDNDLFIIDRLLTSCLMRSIYASLCCDKLNDIKKMYYTELALLKNGIYKKEDINA